MPLPYERASAGDAAIGEIRKMLRAHGATAIGIMEETTGAGERIMIQFEHRGRRVTVPVELSGYAELWLKANPWSRSKKSTEAEWRERAIEKARVAGPSILRDYVKASITMIEAGAFTFEQAFLPGVHLASGQTVYDALRAADGPISLPAPKNPG